MSEFLQWPHDFSDSAPVTRFGESLVRFLNGMIASGASVYADSGWSLFGLSRDSRMIDFVRRGDSRNLGKAIIANRETFWEVWPHDSGTIQRLGPAFGIREHACVVITGIDTVRALSERWLSGMPLSDVLDGMTFWDRMDTSQPLKTTP